MSDCQSWFGSARSKRRSGGGGRGAGFAVSRSPDSCSILRTSVSLIPIASNRISTSRIRLVPYSGCALFSASTASRRGSSFGGSAFFFPGRCGNSASYPPLA
jgi:hypothetical protein